MPKRRTFDVAGVDGCKGGWVVVIASATNQSIETNAHCILKLKSFFTARTFSEVLSKTTDCELVCVDIPIGLSDGKKPRECDVTARRILQRPRASSVFPTPIRPCLSAKDYKTASKICFEHSGKKLSRQSFALLDKIRQVDDLMTSVLQRRVREIHPEISFWSLNNQATIQQNKKTVPGQAQRHKLLQQIFADMDGILSQLPTDGFVMDDAFDALVAAWTAGQTVMRKAETLPENPELDNKGLRMEILCPTSLDNGGLYG